VQGDFIKKDQDRVNITLLSKKCHAVFSKYTYLCLRHDVNTIKITSLLLESLFPFYNVTFLHIYRGDQLRNHDLTALFNMMPNINRLKIDHNTYWNGIDDIRPIQEIGDRLESLDLSFCWKLSSMSMSILNYTPNLTVLDLSGCVEMSDTVMRYIEDLTSLVSLSLRGIKLGNECLKYLGKLDRLTSLDLSRCIRVTDEGLFYLRHLSNLTALSLGGCELISGRGLMKIDHLQNITELDLSYTRLQLGKETLQRFPNIRKLILYRAQMVTDVCKYLRGMDNLTHLDLSNTSLQNQAVSDIAKLTSLQLLDIRQTHISEHALDDLLNIPSLLWSNKNYVVSM
jgi:Leucine-rich repeat (LRR) protein